MNRSEKMRTLKDLAMEISKGESKEKGECCLLRSGFGYPEFDDDELIKKYNATHFDVHWNEPGKSVIVNFYKGNCYGCCSSMEKVHTEIVSIQEER